MFWGMLRGSCAASIFCLGLSLGYQLSQAFWSLAEKVSIRAQKKKNCPRNLFFP